jgi:hypothetical protein
VPPRCAAAYAAACAAADLQPKLFDSSAAGSGTPPDEPAAATAAASAVASGEGDGVGAPGEWGEGPTAGSDEEADSAEAEAWGFFMKAGDIAIELHKFEVLTEEFEEGGWRYRKANWGMTGALLTSVMRRNALRMLRSNEMIEFLTTSLNGILMGLGEDGWLLQEIPIAGSGGALRVDLSLVEKPSIAWISAHARQVVPVFTGTARGAVTFVRPVDGAVSSADLVHTPAAFAGPVPASVQSPLDVMLFVSDAVFNTAFGSLHKAGMLDLKVGRSNLPPSLVQMVEAGFSPTLHGQNFHIQASAGTLGNLGVLANLGYWRCTVETSRHR